MDEADGAIKLADYQKFVAVDIIEKAELGLVVVADAKDSMLTGVAITSHYRRELTNRINKVAGLKQQVDKLEAWEFRFTNIPKEFRPKGKK